MFPLSKHFKKPDKHMVKQRREYQRWSKWDAENIPKGIQRATFWAIQYKYALKEVERLELEK